jgi:hypothetical protein
MKTLSAKSVLHNVIEARETAHTFLKYAIANKKQSEINHWTKQVKIFNNLLTKK